MAVNARTPVSRCLLIFLTAALFIPVAAQAGSSPVSLTFTGVNGETSHGYYIAPYTATVNGVTGTEIWCIDFNHPVDFGDTYTVYTTPILGPDYSRTYLQDSEKYMKMGWLISQYSGQDSTNRAAIQWLLWDISSGEDHSKIFPDLNPQYGVWLARAEANYGNTELYSGYTILTDAATHKQEFITKSPIPEPATLVMVASGLLVLWWFRKKFYEKNRDLWPE